MNKENHSSHLLIMVLAHLIPLLLFLILPKMGISGQWTLAFAVLAMVGAHAWMMKGHSHSHSNRELSQHKKAKEELE